MFQRITCSHYELSLCAYLYVDGVNCVVGRGVCVCVGGGGGKITKGGRAEKARSLRIWPGKARSLGNLFTGGGGGEIP